MLVEGEQSASGPSFVYVALWGTVLRHKAAAHHDLVLDPLHFAVIVNLRLL